MLTGRGEQIFECRPRASEPNAFNMGLRRPDVTLYEGARSVGRLASINMWESNSDRTSVSGSVRATQPEESRR